LNSGLDTLSEDIKSKPSPNSELQVFIKEQLHGLQTEVLKCEEVTTKNREMQELNKSLKAQLEAQQQHSSRLEEQIKSLQKSEVDLKAQADQLKQDLDELKAAPPVPHVDTSEFEQEALDLRQRLEKVGEQLEAANTNVETIERERDSIKVDYVKLSFFASP
jgi:chromosome segregation ATPase